MIFIFNEFLIFKSENFELNPGRHLFDQLSVIYFLRTEKNYYKNDTQIILTIILNDEGLERL